MAILGLANRDVAGRKVGQHGGPGERSKGARRQGCPDIFANFGVQDKVRHIDGVKDQIVAKGHTLAEQLHFLLHRTARRGELALFIEFAIVGQITLGHDAKNSTVVEYDGTVKELALKTQGRAD